MSKHDLNAKQSLALDATLSRYERQKERVAILEQGLAEQRTVLSAMGAECDAILDAAGVAAKAETVATAAVEVQRGVDGKPVAIYLDEPAPPKPALDAEAALAP